MSTGKQLIEQVKELLKQKITPKEIAKKLNITIVAVYNIEKEYNIEKCLKKLDEVTGN